MSLRRIVRRLLAGLVFVVMALFVYLLVLMLTTPDVDDLRNAIPAETSYMRLRAADPTSRAPGRLEAFALRDVSPYLVCAVVKAEDDGFFRHAGFEWSQLRKAFWGYVTNDSTIGGSTITQQLARNLFLGPERSLHRKLREALIARRLERVLDKRRILEIYLNVVEWGDGIWGARHAADAYFGRDPEQLGPFEAAVLASLLPAPRAALRDTNLRRASAVQRRVLRQMLAAKLVDREQFLDAMTRVDLLVQSLSRGDALLDALHRASTTVGTRRTPHQDLRRLDDLLATQCGAAPERTASARPLSERSR